MKPIDHQLGLPLMKTMVIIAILSFAGAIFVPRFLKSQILKRHGVCLQNLETFYEAQKNYRDKTGSYASRMDELSWSPQKEGANYDYRFVRSDGTTFLFECRGNIDRDPTQDRLTVDETGQIQHVENDLTE